MINFLPSEDEYNLILAEYKKVADHIQVFTDEFEDASFFLGKMSATNQLIQLIHDCGIELPDEFYDTCGILQIFNAGKIAQMVGDNGYKGILATLKHPLLAKKDFVC